MLSNFLGYTCDRKFLIFLPYYMLAHETMTHHREQKTGILRQMLVQAIFVGNTDVVYGNGTVTETQVQITVVLINLGLYSALARKKICLKRSDIVQSAKLISIKYRPKDLPEGTFPFLKVQGPICL